MKIAIVEDQKTISNILLHILKCDEYEVDLYEKPSLAVKSISTKRYDLIITALDFRLSSFKGLSLISKLIEKGQKAPVLVVEKPLTPYLKKRAYEEGIFGWIDKPFLHSSIIMTIKRIKQKILFCDERNILREITSFLNIDCLLTNDITKEEILTYIEQKKEILTYLKMKNLCDYEEAINLEQKITLFFNQDIKKVS